MHFLKQGKGALPLLIAFFIYLLIVLFLPKNTFWITDGGNKFLLVQNLIEHNYKEFHIESPGKTISNEPKYSPFQSNDFYSKDNSTFSIYLFLFPYLSSFLYASFGYTGLYIIPIISSILLLIVSEKIYRKIYDEKDSWISIILIGFCSPIFFYSVVFWEMSLYTLLTTFSFLMILDYLDSKNIKYLILASLSTGFSIWTRTDGYLFFAAISGALLFVTGSKKEIPLFIFFVFLSLLPQFIINHKIYGHFIGNHILRVMQLEKTAQLFSFNQIKNQSILSFLMVKAINVFNLLFQFHENWKSSTLLSLPFILLLIPFKKITTGYFNKNRIYAWALPLVTVSTVIAIILNMKKTYPVMNTFYTQGLFLSLPYTILFFSDISCSLTDNKRNKNGQKLLTLTVIIFILLFALIYPSKGGIIWGPRFLLSVVPILVIASLGAYMKMKKTDLLSPLFNKFLVILFMVSFAYQIYGITLLYDKKMASLTMLNKTKDFTYTHIITDIFWLSAEMSSLFYEKTFFQVKNDKDLLDLIILFKKKGVTHFSVAASRFHSKTIDFESIFGDKLFGLNGLNFTLVEQKRELLRLEGLKSHEIIFANYQIK